MSNHSSEIDFKDFTNIYKKMYCKTIFFLLMMLHLSEITLYVLDSINVKEYEN